MVCARVRGGCEAGRGRPACVFMRNEVALEARGLQNPAGRPTTGGGIGIPADQKINGMKNKALPRSSRPFTFEGLGPTAFFQKGKIKIIQGRNRIQIFS